MSDALRTKRKQRPGSPTAAAAAAAVAAFDAELPRKTRDEPKKKKASRACLHCQKAHLTCDDSRPCQRCIKRGIADTCMEGHRKKAKYLLDDDELEALKQKKKDMDITRDGFHGGHHNANEPLFNLAFDSQYTFAAESANLEYSILSAMLGNPSHDPSPPPPPPFPHASHLSHSSLASSSHAHAQQQPGYHVHPSRAGPSTPRAHPHASFSSDGSIGASGPGSISGGGGGGGTSGSAWSSAPHTPQPAAASTPASISVPAVPAITGAGAAAAAVSAGTPTPYLPPPEAPYHADVPMYDVLSHQQQQALLQHHLQHQQSLQRSQQQHQMGMGEMIRNPSLAPPSPPPSNPSPGSPSISASVSTSTGTGGASFGASGTMAGRAASIYRSVNRPYDYTEGYHYLMRYLADRLDKQDILRVVKALATFRPSLISMQMPLSEEDEVFVEQSFQRSLLELEKLVSYSGTPMAVWRRTGEICLVGLEFTMLTDWSRQDLIGGHRYIYELFENQSLVEYWEQFSAHAFENATQTVTTHCVLLKPTGIPVPCAFCFTVRRDIFDLPNIIIGQWLPLL